jgi:uncharacterized protein (DUF362 family)
LNTNNNTPAAHNNKLVSLVRGDNRKENIKNCLRLISSDLEALGKARRILIKPNLTALKPDFANTHVESAEAVIEFIQGTWPGKEIVVGESSATAFYRGLPTKEVFSMFGYLNLEKKYSGVTLTDFDNDTEFIKVPIESVVGDLHISVNKRVRDFDYKISLAIPKTHNFAIATFGIKNMAGGLVTRKEMSMMHGMKGGVEVDAPKTLLDRLPPGTVSRARRILPNGLINFLFKQYPAYRKSVKMIHRNIAAIARVTWPELVILDGWACMEGDGPIDGQQVPLKIAVASTDPLKADGVAARVIGFEPGEIGYLYYLNKDGMGDYSAGGLVGERIEDVSKKFKRHGTYDIQRDWK